MLLFSYMTLIQDQKFLFIPYCAVLLPQRLLALLHQTHACLFTFITYHFLGSSHATLVPRSPHYNFLHHSKSHKLWMVCAAPYHAIVSLVSTLLMGFLPSIPTCLLYLILDARLWLVMIYKPSAAGFCEWSKFQSSFFHVEVQLYSTIYLENQPFPHCLELASVV